MVNVILIGIGCEIGIDPLNDTNRLAREIVKPEPALSAFNSLPHNFSPSLEVSAPLFPLESRLSLPGRTKALAGGDAIWMRLR
jgi:hypothetical protein